MAIVVRYGAEGAALDAAVQAGKGEDFWRRFQAEQGMVRDVRQYYAQQDAMRLEAKRLQMAADAQRRVTGSPIPASARVMQSPMATSIAERVQQQRQQMDQLRQTGVNPLMPQPAQVQGRVIGSGGQGFELLDTGQIRGIEMGPRDAEAAREQERQVAEEQVFGGRPEPEAPQITYLRQILQDPTLSEQQRREITALGGSASGMDPRYVQDMVDQIRDRGSQRGGPQVAGGGPSFSASTVQGQQARYLTDQYEWARDRATELADKLGGPQYLNMTEDQFLQELQQQKNNSWWWGLPDMEDVRERSSAELATFRQMKQLQSEAKQHQSQYQKLLTSAQATGPRAEVFTPQTHEEYAALPSGSRYIDPDTGKVAIKR